LSAALAAGRRLVEGTATTPSSVAAAMAAMVATEPLVTLDYASALDAASLDALETFEAGHAVRLLIAARVGPVRLIDNCAAHPGGGALVTQLVASGTRTNEG